MSTLQPALLCNYRYDPLDRLTSQNLPETPAHQRFYCQSRLATEIQGALHHCIVQHDDQLLAQQRRQGDERDTTLLSTDPQRSVLHTFQANHPPRPNVYTAYGHHSATSGLTSLMGFNGERPDPVTGHYLLGNGYRAFNPVLMRFNSPDSLSPFGKGGLNSYAYCLGDPINRNDSSGNFSKFILAGVSRWRARLDTNATNRQKAVTELVETGSLEIFGERYELKPGVHALQGVKAKERYMHLYENANGERNSNGKFSDDLFRAIRESESYAKLTGEPAHEYPPRKMLEYIKKRPGENISGTFSYSRLRRIEWDFDPSVALHKRPDIAELIRYGKQMSNARNSDIFLQAANVVRDNHFNKIKRPAPR